MGALGSAVTRDLCYSGHRRDTLVRAKEVKSDARTWEYGRMRDGDGISGKILRRNVYKFEIMDCPT